jgi:hypothetical protein
MRGWDEVPLKQQILAALGMTGFSEMSCRLGHSEATRGICLLGVSSLDVGDPRCGRDDGVL